MTESSRAETARLPMKCAWCGKVMQPNTKTTPIISWSHGICSGCFPGVMRLPYIRKQKP